MNYNKKMTKQFRRSFVAVLFSLGFAGSTVAQTSRTISLAEAIALGVRNSKQLKISNAKLLQATASLRQEKDHRLPDVSASGSYLRVSKPTIKMLADMSSGGSGGSEGSSATPSVDQAMYAMANASLPIFDGFKTQAAIASARYLETAARLDVDNDRQAVVQNTIAAYSNLFKALAAVDLVKENLKQAQQRTADFINLEKNGIIPRNDLLRAQLQESNIQLSLMDAESNWRVANTNMNLMLGLPEETILQPDTNGMNATNTDERNLLQWEQTALDSRSDLKSLEYRERAANAGIKSAKGAYFPTLKITGGYLALNVPNFIRVTDAWNGGIGINYSISSLWKTGNSVAAAKARLEEVHASHDMALDQVKLDISRAYEDYLLSRKKIDVYAKAVEQAQENYRIVKNKHENSLATTTDLLDADVQQLQAKINYTFSKADALVAYNRLLQVAGILDTAK